MKVILKQDVKGVGLKNTIVEVNGGYAKNFLIKKNLAVSYNDKNLRDLEKDLDILNMNNEKRLDEEKEIKLKLEKMFLEFELKTNNGAAFGHITNKALLSEINKDEKLINKFMFDEPYKITLGPSKIKINLSKDTSAIIKVNVKAI